MTFRDVFRPGNDPGGESSHVHDAGDISGSMPFVRVVGGVHVPNLEARVNVLETTGLRLYVVEYFTSSGTFEKADYPGLRAVRVTCVGAGGGGGGCAATGAGEVSVSGAGHAGAIAISFVLADDLNPAETVTVGAGGSGGSGTNDGSPGGASSFGSHCSAGGGNGGAGGAASSSAVYSGNSAGSQSMTGDITFPGATASPRFTGLTGTTPFGIPFPGANSPYGRGGEIGANSNGGDALGFGAGGGATRNASNQASARSGGDGAPGIVIVEVYV